MNIKIPFTHKVLKVTLTNTLDYQIIKFLNGRITKDYNSTISPKINAVKFYYYYSNKHKAYKDNT